MLCEDPSCFYRMSGVLDYINNLEIQFKNILGTQQFNWSLFSGCSHLLLQRPHSEAHMAIMLLAKDMGLKIISDWDDDLLNVAVHKNDSIKPPELRRNVKRCLSLCDEVWVTTPALKAVYKPFNKNIHVIPNSHHDHIFPVDKRMPFTQRKMMTYRGGASHIEDLQGNVNDLVKTIRENKQWEFRFIGSGIEKEKGGFKSQFEILENMTQDCKNHTYTLASTLIQFFKLYYHTNAPIAFFPLLNNKFNASKSNISLLEATYAGSAFLGNKTLPEFDFPFVTDISEGVYEPFMALKDNYSKMLRLNDEAWEWVKENRLLTNINKLREERLLS